MPSRYLAIFVLALSLAGCESPGVKEAFVVLDEAHVPSAFTKIGDGHVEAEAYRLYHAPPGSVEPSVIAVPKGAVPEDDAELRARSRGFDWEFLGIWAVPSPGGKGHCELRFALAKDVDEVFFNDLSEAEKDRVRSGEMELVELSASCVFA